MVIVHRGEIWWANLPASQWSEPGFKRPVFIIQSNPFNESNISTTIAAVITSNLKLAQAPGNILLSKSESLLSKDSVINVSQIITLDKTVLTEFISKPNAQVLKQVNQGLELILGLHCS